MSSLPLGANHIKIERSLTTSSVAVFVPFVTQELFMGGDAMYYGVNAKTGNMIMLDRKRARLSQRLEARVRARVVRPVHEPAKSEIVPVCSSVRRTTCISATRRPNITPVKRLHGQVVKLSPTSNPM